MHLKSVLVLQARAPLLLEFIDHMSRTVLFSLIIVDSGACSSLVSESKSVNRQTEMLLDLGLLSWYTAGSGSVIFGFTARLVPNPQISLRLLPILHSHRKLYRNRPGQCLSGNPLQSTNPGSVLLQLGPWPKRQRRRLFIIVVNS